MSKSKALHNITKNIDIYREGLQAPAITKAGGLPTVGCPRLRIQYKLFIPILNCLDAMSQRESAMPLHSITKKLIPTKAAFVTVVTILRHAVH